MCAFLLLLIKVRTTKSAAGVSLKTLQLYVRGLGRGVLGCALLYPVPWQAPSLVDYQTFAAVMNSQPGQKTLLHCQMNYRASAFSFLYRVLELDTSLDDAARDLFAVWTPDQTWLEFINNVLAANNRAALLPPTDL